MCVLSTLGGNVDKHSPFDIYIYIYIYMFKFTSCSPLWVAIMVCSALCSKGICHLSQTILTLKPIMMLWQYDLHELCYRMVHNTFHMEIFMTDLNHFAPRDKGVSKCMTISEVPYNALLWREPIKLASMTSLTHLPRDKMAIISQTIFSDAFSWMKRFFLFFTEVCSQESNWQ